MRVSSPSSSVLGCLQRSHLSSQAAAGSVKLLVQVFMVSSKKIQERNYETLFRWLTQSNKINFIGRVVLSVPPMWQVLPADSPHCLLDLPHWPLYML